MYLTAVKILNKLPVVFQFSELSLTRSMMTMYDTAVLCVLAYFRITSAVIRKAHSYAGFLCNFVINNLQRYLSKRKKEFYIFCEKCNYAKQSTGPETLSRKISRRKNRKPNRGHADINRPSTSTAGGSKRNDPPYKKRKVQRSKGDPDDSDHSSSADSHSEGRRSNNPPHGTCVNCNQIFQCNLRKARKVTVSFEFVPKEGTSDVEFYNLPDRNAIMQSPAPEEGSQSDEVRRVEHNSGDENRPVNPAGGLGANENRGPYSIWLQAAQGDISQDKTVQDPSRMNKISEDMALESGHSTKMTSQFNDERDCCDSGSVGEVDPENIPKLNDTKDRSSMFPIEIPDSQEIPEFEDKEVHRVNVTEEENLKNIFTKVKLENEDTDQQRVAFHYQHQTSSTGKERGRIEDKSPSIKSIEETVMCQHGEISTEKHSGEKTKENTKECTVTVDSEKNEQFVVAVDRFEDHHEKEFIDETALMDKQLLEAKLSMESPEEAGVVDKQSEVVLRRECRDEFGDQHPDEHQNKDFKHDDEKSEEGSSDDKFVKNSITERKNYKDTDYTFPVEVASGTAPLQAASTSFQHEVENQSLNKTPPDNQLSEKPVNVVAPDYECVKQNDHDDEDLKQRFQQRKDLTSNEETSSGVYNFEKGPIIILSPGFILDPTYSFERNDKLGTSEFVDESSIHSFNENDKLLFNYATKGGYEPERGNVSGESGFDDSVDEGYEKYTGRVVDYCNPLNDLPRYFDHQIDGPNKLSFIEKDDMKCFTLGIYEPKNNLHLLLKAAVLDVQDSNENIKISKEREDSKEKSPQTVATEETDVLERGHDQTEFALHVEYSEGIGIKKCDIQTADDEYSKETAGDSGNTSPESQRFEQSIPVEEPTKMSAYENEQLKENKSKNLKRSKSKRKSKGKQSQKASVSLSEKNEPFVADADSFVKTYVERIEQATDNIDHTKQSSPVKTTADVETENISAHVEHYVQINVERHKQAVTDVNRTEMTTTEIKRPEKNSENVDLSEKIVDDIELSKETAKESFECHGETSEVFKRLSPSKPSQHDAKTSDISEPRSPKSERETVLQTDVDRQRLYRTKKDDRSTTLVARESKIPPKPNQESKEIKYHSKDESTRPKEQIVASDLGSGEDDPYSAVLFEKGPTIPITADFLLRPPDRNSIEADPELEAPDFNEESSLYKFNSIDNLFYNFIKKNENTVPDERLYSSSDHLNQSLPISNESSEISPKKSETTMSSPDLSPATTVSSPSSEENYVGVVIDYYNPMTHLPKYFEKAQQTQSSFNINKEKIECIIIKPGGRSEEKNSQFPQPPQEQEQSSQLPQEDTSIPKKLQGDDPLGQQSPQEDISLEQTPEEVSMGQESPRKAASHPQPPQ